jgi:hypothetical protein
VEEWQSQARTGKKARISPRITKNKKGSGMTQMVQCFPSNLKALSSNCSKTHIPHTNMNEQIIMTIELSS